MPPSPYRPAELQWQLFSGADAVRRGLLTPHQLRSLAWLRLFRDVYADARLDRDHALSCRAVRIGLPTREFAFAGPSAAYLHGIEHAAGFGDDVHILVAAKTRVSPHCGLRPHSTAHDPADLTTVGGLRCTTPVRTAWDCAGWLDVVRAVAVLDTLLARGLVSHAELLGYVPPRTGQRGARRAARAFDLADGRAQSPPESQLRVRLIRSGLPRPEAQHPVNVHGGRTLHPDLCWPQFRVAVEYDGWWHADPDQLHHDRRRLNRLVAEGWIVLHVTSRRMREDFPGVVREIRAALVSRGWRPA